MMPSSSNGTNSANNLEKKQLSFDNFSEIINKNVLDDIASDLTKDGQNFINKMHPLPISEENNSNFGQDEIYSKVPLQLADFNEDFYEPRTSKKQTRTTIHKQIDLHGFTVSGAIQLVRRTILQSDPSHTLVLKIGVGKGTHSKGGKNVLRSAMHELFGKMQLDPPTENQDNQGYLLAVIHPRQRPQANSNPNP